jgi:hypothetical protein
MYLYFSLTTRYRIALLYLNRAGTMSDNLASAPPDPSALSYLDLPAEIRNFIYAEVYEHAEPIVVTHFDRTFGPVTMHRRMDDHKGELPCHLRSLNIHSLSRYVEKELRLTFDSVSLCTFPTT